MLHFSSNIFKASLFPSELNSIEKNNGFEDIDAFWKATGKFIKFINKFFLNLILFITDNINIKNLMAISSDEVSISSYSISGKFKKQFRNNYP